MEGSQAPHAKKQVILHNKDGKFLQLSPQYVLPLKKSHVYLGAIISYDDFETLNARHRAHAGHVAFTRLRPYLTARRTLPLHKRLALWKATVATSTLYSITASGPTPKSFDLIRIQMTRQIRAIANSPRHLTLESDVALFDRLHLTSPGNIIESRLQALVDRTAALSQVLHQEDLRIMPAIKDWETLLLQDFRNMCSHPLKQVDAEHVCNECHATFDTAAALRQHIGRLHSKARRAAESEVFDHHKHGTDGMPICRRCGHKFARWTELNKHITGNFCQAAPVDEITEPIKDTYLQQARDLPAESRDPRTMVLTDDLKEELLHHCAICRQWQPNSRYIKIHYTRVHPDYWRQHQASTQNWRRLHIPRIKAHCTWCGGTPSAGGIHSDSCPVLFQITMINAIVQDELQPNTGEEASEAVLQPTMPPPEALKHWDRRCQFCQHTCTNRGFRKHMRDQHAEWWRKHSDSHEAFCSAWAQGLSKPKCQYCDQQFQHRAQHAGVCYKLFQEAVHRCIQAHPDDDPRIGDGGERCCDAAQPAITAGNHRRVRHLPPDGVAGSSAAADSTIQQKSQDGGGTATGHQATQVHTAERRTAERGVQPTSLGALRWQQIFGQARAHDDHHGSPLLETGRGTPATSHGQAVHDSLRERTPGPTSSFLRDRSKVARGSEQNPAGGQELLTRVHGEQHVVGTLQQVGEDAPGRDDPEQLAQARVDQQGRQQAAVALQDLGREQVGDRHKQAPNRASPNVGHGHGTQNDLREGNGAAGTQVSQHPQVDGERRGNHTPVHAILELPRGPGGPGTPPVLGSVGQHGDAAHRGSHEAGESQAASIGGHVGQGAGSDEGRDAVTRQFICGMRLQNNSNICYINATVMLWLWACGVTQAFDDMAGTASRALRTVLQKRGKIHLLELLPWQCYFRGWPQITSQHDVRDWHIHLFPQAMPPHLRGHWQARLLNLQMRDNASTVTPVLMTLPVHLQECSLQTLVDQWCAQEAVHALTHPPRVLGLCLNRFTYVDAAEKLSMPVRLQTVDVHIPCFVDEQSLHTYSCVYQTLGAIAHYGHNINAGHYRTFLYSHTDKIWHVTDDNTRAKRAKPGDLQHLDRNAYIVWLRLIGKQG